MKHTPGHNSNRLVKSVISIVFITSFFVLDTSNFLWLDTVGIVRVRACVMAFALIISGTLQPCIFTNVYLKGGGVQR